MIIREERHACLWTHVVQFSKVTLKFSFITWLTKLDRSSTMNIVLKQSIRADNVCVLCQTEPETCNHLFYGCSFSSQIWKNLCSRILQNSYTTRWNVLKRITVDKSLEFKILFCIIYTLQFALYALWKEHNRRRFGESLMQFSTLGRSLTNKSKIN